MVVEPKQQSADTTSGVAENDISTKEENVAAAATEDDDDDEYEYIEYDVLTEDEFTNSEWLVGTNWDRNPRKIDETWCRLVFDKDNKAVAIWGDRSRGTWKLDVATQFLSISKESLWAGKEIWACTVSRLLLLAGHRPGLEVLGGGRSHGTVAGQAARFERQGRSGDAAVVCGTTRRRNGRRHPTTHHQPPQCRRRNQKTKMVSSSS